MSETGGIPEWLREQLPEDLKEAEISGVEAVPVTKSARLYGPPGTGKTTQLALRTAVRADEEDLSPGDMTVVTFRRSLADALRERLVEWGVFEAIDGIPLTDDANPYYFWRTVHAVSARATGFFDDIDTGPGGNALAGMVGEDAMRRFCNQHGITFKPPRRWYETRWTTFYALYRYCKNNLLDVGEWRYLNTDAVELRALEEDTRAWRLLQEFYDEWGRGASFRAVAAAWESFKHEHDVYDFYEQLEAGLVGPLPPMRHVVIDEFHDAYPLMAELVVKWVENADVALVAGDPDQVVNAFSGADPRFFERLDESVTKNVPVVLLDKSFRCPDEHFEAAARMLRKERSVPDIETAGKGLIYPYSPTPISHDEETDEWTLPPIDERGSPMWFWRNYGPGVMYLCRTQKQVTGVGVHLDEHGVVYDSQDGVAGDWSKRLALMRALRLIKDVRPPRQGSLTDESQYDFDTVGGKALSTREAAVLIEHSDARTLHDKSALLDRVNTARLERTSVPLSDFAEHVKWSWWERYAAGIDSIHELVYTDDRDQSAMKKAWNRYSDETEWTVTKLSSGTKLWTIHASKGDEATDVVVYDGITGRVQREIDEHQDVRENEARTWYVALSRSSENLHIVRGGHDWVNPHLPDDLEPAAARAARVNTAGGSTGVSADD